MTDCTGLLARCNLSHKHWHDEVGVQTSRYMIIDIQASQARVSVRNTYSRLSHERYVR